VCIQPNAIKALPKEARKRRQVETAPKKSREAKLIKLADKTSNLRTIASICDGEIEVLSLSWKGTDPFTVEIFRPGAWEAKLEELSITASIATWWRAA
jgi:hypothetical protein